MARLKRAVEATESSEPKPKKTREEMKATAATSQPGWPSDAKGPLLVSKRTGKEVPVTAATSRPRRVAGDPIQPTPGSRAAKAITRAKKANLSDLPGEFKPSKPSKPSTGSISAKTPKEASVPVQAPQAPGSKPVSVTSRGSHFSIIVPDIRPDRTAIANSGDDEENDDEDSVDTTGVNYWLMKAEPESRIEKGIDVKFSIDDLAARTKPEPWDGVRNLVARNNMRSMTKGDLAFFYHSNCKVPGIVGIMEVVEEHAVDESAFDPDHPYYDEKSLKDKPKWFMVRVEFRQKFADIISLKRLQMFAKDGGVLENMQTLKQTRLSVSKVSKREWDFINGLVEK